MLSFNFGNSQHKIYFFFVDCWDLFQDRAPGTFPPGVDNYWIQLEGLNHLLNVSCNQGWTYIQRRTQDDTCGRISFEQPWDAYRGGFGSLDCDFWLGNEKIHLLTSQPDRPNALDVEVCLQVDEMNGENGCEIKHARYQFIEVREEEEGYELVLGDYREPALVTVNDVDQSAWPEAGDALLRLYQQLPTEDPEPTDEPEPTDFPQSEASQAGQMFSTYDDDRDNNSFENCANQFLAGWWFNNCTSSNPNGPRVWTPFGLRAPGEISIFWDGIIGNTSLSGYSIAGISLRIRPRVDFYQSP